MLKNLITLFFLTSCTYVNAQHIGYRDRTRPILKQQATDTIKKEVKDTAAAEIFTPHSECPASQESFASLPVVTNFVPQEIIDKFKEKFEGHVYSITSLKVSKTELQYKLKVCYKGDFVIRFVDKSGTIVR